MGTRKQKEIKYGDVFLVNFDKVFPNAKCTHYQKGIRPCIIVSNDMNNQFCDLVAVLPLTTKGDKLPQHLKLVIDTRDNYTVPEQLVTISKEFIYRKIKHLNKFEMLIVKESLRIQFNL